MVDIAPFVGVRFARDDLRDVTAPPYDAIDDALSAELHARSPHNVVRLERGEGRASDVPGRDRYQRAAATYADWIDGGVLVRDAEPCLHVYEQRYDDGGRERLQRGVLAALRVVPWSAGEVLAHERVFDGPVRDRLRLLEALPVNVSPVYVLATPEPADVAGVLDELAAAPPDAAFTDHLDAVQHRLWRVPDGEAARRLVAGYRDATVVMADGHHRYTTALEYHARHGGPGSDRILAYVVGVGAEGAGASGGAPATGPVIRAMHRLVRAPVHDLPARLDDLGWPVRRRDDLDLGGALEALARGGLVSVALTPDGALELGRPPADAAGGLELPPALAAVPVALVHALLVGPLGVPDGPDDLVYTGAAEPALREVRRGAAAALFLVPPPTVEDVVAAAAAGALMPPKSTSFFPKPRTGLVLRPLR